MSVTVVKNAPNPMVQMYALRGEFTDVTYFMTSLTLSECVDQLHFAPAEDADTFGDRVQRRLDTRRADKIFADYLKKKGARFFNSLVVVLMPKPDTNRGYFRFIPFEDDAGNILGNVGVLEVLTSIDRIVVDGQHRLRALRQAHDYSREPSYDRELGLAEVRVPVVFLTFNDIDGEYRPTKPLVHDLTRRVAGHSRRVFIDLNKTAKKVDKNSLLILDDDDFSAVSARYLIETNGDLELYTKWADSGSTLADADPFFTNIYLLDQFVQEILTEEVERRISNNYQLSLDEERQRAIEEYLLGKSAENDGLIPAEMIGSFFTKLSFFEDWRNQIRGILSGDPAKQPKPTEATVAQRRDIRSMHREHLLSTVAGQRAAFLAVLRSYRHLEYSPDEAWCSALDRLDQIHSKGLYSRHRKLWLELLIRPGNRMRVNAVNASADVLEHLIRLEPPENLKSYIRPEDGVGTPDTVTEYQIALTELGIDVD